MFFVWKFVHPSAGLHGLHLWQPQVGIEQYSVAYFDPLPRSKHSSAELLLRVGSYALCKCGKYSWVYPVSMSPTLSGSSALEHFERGNAIEIRNIMFDFYPGLPHLHLVLILKRFWLHMNSSYKYSVCLFYIWSTCTLVSLVPILSPHVNEKRKG